MDIWQQFLSLNEQETANQKKKKEPFWSKMEEVKRDKSEIFFERQFCLSLALSCNTLDRGSVFLDPLAFCVKETKHVV